MKILRINDPSDGGGASAGNDVFSDPGAGNGSGGAPGEGSTPPSGGSASTASAPDGAQPAALASGSPPTAPQLTPEAIADAIKKAGIGGQPAQPQQPPKQYTQEDFDKAFQVFQATPEMITQLLAGGEGALKVFHSIRDGLVRQAVTMASYVIQDQLERYQQEFNPKFSNVEKYVSERQMKELYDEFYSENKDLKPYNTLVETAVQQLKAEGVQFKTKAEGFKAAAERARQLLKSIPGLNLTSPDDGGGAPNPTRMPTLSRGGQGGVGKGQGGGQGAKDPSHAVFG